MCGRTKNIDVNKQLTILRNNLRTGVSSVSNGNLRALIASYIGPISDENLHPKTIVRLNTLFDVPFTEGQFGKKWPSPDNYAWAIQNFINRRSDPWSFKRAKEVIPGLETSLSI